MENKIVLIGEIGHNFSGSISKAKELLHAVKESKWTMAKLQLYKTESIKSPTDQNFTELKEAELTFDQAAILKDYADRIGIELFFSVFDTERTYWATMLNVKRYKIASRSIFDEDLVNLVLSRGKHTIISLGEWKQEGFPNFQGNIDYLLCWSRRKIMKEGIPILPEIFGRDGYSGFSDHCIGNEIAMEALNRGATILEKHVCLNHNHIGWDTPASATPDEMRELYNYKRYIEDLEENKNG